MVKNLTYVVVLRNDYDVAKLEKQKTKISILTSDDDDDRTCS